MIRNPMPEADSFKTIQEHLDFRNGRIKIREYGTPKINVRVKQNDSEQSAKYFELLASTNTWL
jgi:hypothetical protein